MHAERVSTQVTSPKMAVFRSSLREEQSLFDFSSPLIEGERIGRDGSSSPASSKDRKKIMQFTKKTNKTKKKKTLNAIYFNDGAGPKTGANEYR